jgi:hypothetical protein
MVFIHKSKINSSWTYGSILDTKFYSIDLYVHPYPTSMLCWSQEIDLYFFLKIILSTQSISAFSKLID